MNRISTLERENQRLSQNNRNTFQQPGADIRLPSFLPGEGGRGSQVKGSYNDGNNAVLNHASYKLATTNTPTSQTQYLQNTQPHYLQTKSSYIPQTQTTQNNAAYYPVVQSLYNDAARQQQYGSSSANLGDSYKINSSQHYHRHGSVNEIGRG